MRKLFLALLLSSLAPSTLAQTPTTKLSPKDAAIGQQLQDKLKSGQSEGIALSSTSNVQESVNIEAVMLPNKIVRSVFGKEVAENYAVIEVNVSNRNPDAAFILASLYIDYSQWGLANGTLGFDSNVKPRGYASASDSRLVSSVEYRVIRGELLDRQPYSRRNMAFRSIKVLGEIGTAFAFPFSTDVIKGINAWNGGVVPGFEELFPDGTTAQMNRISDYGFRNNKVIPQQSADIVIAFFPIKRFLSPTLEKIFKESPALFFDPLLLALDPQARKGLEPMLEAALAGDVVDDHNGNRKAVVDTALNGLLQASSTAPGALQVLATRLQVIARRVESTRSRFASESARYDQMTDDASRASQKRALDQIEKELDQESMQSGQALADLDKQFTKPKSAALYLFLSQISLSKIAIVVGGTMNVDEQTIPASISETCFDKPTPELWGKKGPKSCFVRGRFLLHGTPKFQPPDGVDLGITDITPQESASSSDLLSFTYTLANPIDPTPKFTLLVTKEGKNKTSVDSTPYAVDPKTLTFPTPKITTITPDGTALIITGNGFFSIPKTHPLKVTLTAPKIPPVVDDSPTVDSTDKITLPAEWTKKLNGCYTVVVENGTSPSNPGAQKVNVDGNGKVTTPTACPQ